jgi:hypothetical protein
MSPRENELALLSGFMAPNADMAHGARKTAAWKMRARVTGATLAREAGPGGAKISRKLLAEAVGVSERIHLATFTQREAVFAFPPPEMGEAFVAVASDAISWADLGARLRPVFTALDMNGIGKQLIRDLVAVHAYNPELEQSDGYFATELRCGFDSFVKRSVTQTRGLAGYLTEGLREALRDWVTSEESSIMSVSDGVEELVKRIPMWGEDASQ